MDAGNSKSSAPGRPFPKGVSGNPSGRPKGVAARAREKAGGNPDALLDVLLEVAQDTSAKHSDRITAAKEYLDRGWGKAASFAPVEDGDPLELNDIEREIARLGDELAARRATKTAGAAAQGGVAGNGQNGAASAGR